MRTQTLRAARPLHFWLALRAVVSREVVKFAQQRGRLLSGLVRPLLWLAVFGAGFQNVFGMAIIPPYETYITYQTYMAPGLLGIVLLFGGMLSSLAMVYDREMGMMRLLLTAPLPRPFLLGCKLVAGASLAVLQCYAFLAICWFFDVRFAWLHWLAVLPALIATGLMLGSLGLLLSVYSRQMENFAAAMNFVIFPVFFMSTALYPLWKLRESGAEWLYWVAAVNPFTHGVELIRSALYGIFNAQAAAIVAGATIVFFIAASIGYDPQKGAIRKARQAG